MHTSIHSYMYAYKHVFDMHICAQVLGNAKTAVVTVDASKIAGSYKMNVLFVEIPGMYVCMYVCMYA